MAALDEHSVRRRVHAHEARRRIQVGLHVCPPRCRRWQRGSRKEGRGRDHACRRRCSTSVMHLRYMLLRRLTCMKWIWFTCDQERGQRLRDALTHTNVFTQSNQHDFLKSFFERICARSHAILKHLYRLARCNKNVGVLIKLMTCTRRRPC